MNLDNLYSKEHEKLNRAMHKKSFGASGYRWHGIVRDLIIEFSIESLLDYGCGRSTLWSEIKKRYPNLTCNIEYKEYDPFFKGKEVCPEPTDMVTCTDVLEHIEPKLLDNVLLHIKSLTKGLVFLNINTKLANKKLPDGRNAHLIVKKGEWWAERLSTVFTGDDWEPRIIPTTQDKNFNIVLIKNKE